MAKSAISNTNPKGSLPGIRRQPNWPVAVFVFLLGTLLIVAFLDYTPDQSGTTITTHPTGRNLVGLFGAKAAFLTLRFLGMSAWLVPVFLLWFGYILLRNAPRLALTRLVAMVLCIGSFSGLWAMWESFGVTQYFSQGLGGLLGILVYQDGFKDTLGVFGSALLMGSLYALSLLFIFTKDITTEIERILAALHAWRERRRANRAEHEELTREFKESQIRQKAAEQAANEHKQAAYAASAAAASALTIKKNAQAQAKALEASAQPPKKNTGAGGADTWRNKEGLVDEIVPDDAAQPTVRSEEIGSSASDHNNVIGERESRGSKTGMPASNVKDLAAQAGGRFELNIVKPEEPKKSKVATPSPSDSTYQFPPLALLKEQTPVAPENSEEEHRRNAENLLRILSEFGVQVSLGEIHVGPVITRYEIVPAPGVRVEKIAGLDKNIALGMRAQSVRILAPIPGKAAVGVEVPNQHPTAVGMREILESEDWSIALSKGEIPVALGKDVSGKPIVSDLTKMPHLLIAGATGSGKSVCINSIVASILYSKSPKDLRLIMVDPKIVELKIFNTLPHMLIPVVTEPKKVPAALKWLLGEMEQRYQIFAKMGVRNIVGFNNRKKTPTRETSLEQPGLEGIDPATDDGLEIPARLPYIVAIIDELADLMMVAPAEIETSIARLAQLARAAGIHLIIATQRPSVNVITGVIKANLPSRIAFQVASQVDSRTILDTKGADTLIGRGDMLFSPPGSSRLIRAQGAFVSDDEVHSVVDFLKKNGPPIYANDVQAQIDRDAREGDEDEDEDADDSMGDDGELYKQALDVLRSTRRASTSMIQRRLRIGYNRAARIMDLMEEKGVVGPDNGSSPREILVDLDTL